MRRLVLFVACALTLVTPAAAMAAAGTVEGTVTPAEWAQEVEVCVAEASHPTESCVVPAADGSYSFHGFPSGMKIEFIPTYRSRLLPQYYDHKSRFSEATAIGVAEGSVVTGIDADLVEGGAIMGTVSAADAGGTPLAEVEVCAVSSATPTMKSCGETDAVGDYELHSLPTGSYRVGFSGSGASAEYEALRRQAVSVTAGSTTEGVDASLVVGAQIRGVVSAATTGVRLDGIPACLFAAADPVPQRCTFSNSAGEYAFEGLPSGSYQVGFSLEPGELGGESAGSEDGFASQYYDLVGRRAEAAVISLIAPQVIGGVDAVLSPLQAPLAPAPVSPVAAPTVPAPAVIAAPTAKTAACKKPKRRQKVKGKVRCVKPTPHKQKKAPRHKRRKASHRRGGKNR